MAGILIKIIADTALGQQILVLALVRLELLPRAPDGNIDRPDIAEIFVFLASDKSRKATGALFTIDGGQLAG